MTLLERHITSFEEAVERLNDRTHPSPDLRDLEERIELALGYFSVLQNSVARWKEHSATASMLDLERAAHFEKLYHLLGRAFDSIADAIEASSVAGNPIDSNRFLIAHRELRGLLAFSLDRVHRAMGQIQAGQSRPLAEVMDELRHRTGA